MYYIIQCDIQLKSVLPPIDKYINEVLETIIRTLGGVIPGVIEDSDWESLEGLSVLFNFYRISFHKNAQLYQIMLSPSSIEFVIIWWSTINS